MNKKKLSELVALRIEQMRLATPGPGGKIRTQEAVAEGIGISRSNYVNKTTLKAGKEGWSIDQAEAVAEYYRRATGRDLIGWPFVEESVSEMLGHVVSLIDSKSR